MRTPSQDGGKDAIVPHREGVVPVQVTRPTAPGRPPGRPAPRVVPDSTVPPAGPGAVPGGRTAGRGTRASSVAVRVGLQALMLHVVGHEVDGAAGDRVVIAGFSSGWGRADNYPACRIATWTDRVTMPRLRITERPLHRPDAGARDEAR